MIQVCVISNRLGSDGFKLGDDGGVNEGKLGKGIVTLTDLTWRWNDIRWERKVYLYSQSCARLERNMRRSLRLVPPYLCGDLSLKLISSSIADPSFWK
jgi:hypothetical protein